MWSNNLICNSSGATKRVSDRFSLSKGEGLAQSDLDTTPHLYPLPLPKGRGVEFSEGSPKFVRASRRTGVGSVPYSSR